MANESMFTIIVGAFVLIAGLIGLASYSGIDISSSFGVDLSGLKTPTGKFLENIFQSDAVTVNFSARLMSSDAQDISFKFREPVESIVLRYADSYASLYLNNMPFSSENTSIELYEFKGDFMITDKITLDGKVSGFFLDNYRAIPEVPVPVKAVNLSLDYIMISGISGKSFVLNNVYGVVNVSAASGTIIYDKTAGDMEIKSFDGTLRIEDNVIYLEGTGILKADVLKSPGI